jgi:hypothetical protein
VRSHWLKMGYWRFLWARLPWEVRWVVLAALLLGLLGGGWVAASAATSNDGAEVAIGSNPIIIETTVQKVITVRENGKIIRKIVPVVKRVKVLQRAGTVYETRREYVTQIVKKPGGRVTRTVSELVPVVTTEQITVNGKPRIVTKTQFQSTTRTKTVPLTQTLVATQNVTQIQTQTAPPVTDTKTTTESRTQTQTRTQTVNQTQTETETRTVTETQIVTVTPDAVTVTVTPDPVTVTRTETETETKTVTVDSGGG